MTTVNFWADPIDGPGHRISIGNGLGGPATAAFFRLVDLIREGRVEGQADDASASARLPGYLLREMLSGLGDDHALGVQREGYVDEASLQAAIIDTVMYGVQAVEV